MDQPEVTRAGALDMQVCVPNLWPDEEVVGFANVKNPCGTKLGWVIRKHGDPLLEGKNERVPCSKKTGFVHIMLDA